MSAAAGQPHDGGTVDGGEEGYAFPMSFAQQRQWFLETLHPGHAAYHIPLSLRLSGPLDAAALEGALGDVVRRHEVLRTVYLRSGGEPVQVVLPFAGFALALADLSALPPAVRGAETRRLLREEARAPFDLAWGPVLRARLLRLAADEHVLLATLHHIAGDGWSMQVLVREVGALYEARLAGQPSPLPELAIQYGDFAVWQRERMQGEPLERELAWWRGRLAGAPTLELPTDRPRPPVQGQRGAMVEATLPPGVAPRLLALTRGHDTTLFSALLAAFYALLHRWSGEADLSVGTTVAGRGSAETETLIGFFVNTLVLRADVGGDPSFAALVERVAGVVRGALEHQDLPFEKLVAELRPDRDLGRSPLFQVMFVLLSHGPRERRMGPLLVEPLLGSAGVTAAETVETARFDLLMTLSHPERDADELHAYLEYSTDLFDAATAGRLLAAYVRVLQAAAADPALRVGELPVLGDEDRARLAAWNHTARPRPADATLVELFAAQARRTPGAVAVVDQAERVSYAELDRRSSRIARALSRRGIGPEARVGVFLERSVDMVAALLGVLRAGAAYVPLDPGDPPARLAHVLRDSGAALLLTTSGLAGRIPAAGVPALHLDAEDAAIAAEPGEDPGIAVDPRSLAYVIYTSGSTGLPKGAMNEHRAVANRLLWMQEEYGIGPDDAVLHKTPVSFDVSVWELFWPLLSGARLVVARPGGHRDPGYLAGVIEREGVTTTHFVPSMLRPFLDEPRLAERCASLRRVVCSGEALPAELAARFLDALPGCALQNLYGPTEAAVDVTHHRCLRGEAVVPIGRPVANTRVHVVDAGGSPCAVGAPGELLIGGVQVGRGYLGRPALTAERFVPDPFSPVPGARLYRTGDRARWLAEGELEYRGRLDAQVKVRGVRIEPGEVEAALLEHPEVRTAAVAAQAERGGDARLVAYVVPRDASAPPAPDALREVLGWKLPEPMVPSAFVVLGELPLTPSGKLDRARLPAPGSAGAARMDAAPLLPRSGPERGVAAIWEEVLGVERVGVDENFFDLGGHSLLVVRVQQLLRERMGVDLPVTELFRHPTVRLLARRVGGDAPAAALKGARGGARAALRKSRIGSRGER